MPVDGALQFQVDRYLVPLSVSRQTIQLQDVGHQPLATALQPNIIYDPIAKTITVSRPASSPGKVNEEWLLPLQTYRVVFAPDGLRALDGATLRADQTLVFEFRVGPAIDPAKARPLFTAVNEPTSISFCNDVLPIFAEKCSGPLCHGSGNGGTQAAGLILDSSEGVARTALNQRVANGANTGPASGAATAESSKFGVDMPVIQPGSPGNSWLMYKIDLAAESKLNLLKEGGATVCGPQQPPIEPSATIDYTTAKLLAKNSTGLASLTNEDAERAVLSDYVLGREMPYPVPVGKLLTYPTSPLNDLQRQKVRMWIARGASTPLCGGCADGADAGADGGDAGDGGDGDGG